MLATRETWHESTCIYCWRRYELLVEGVQLGEELGLVHNVHVGGYQQETAVHRPLEVMISSPEDSPGHNSLSCILCTVLCCTVLYCTVLYCTDIHWPGRCSDEEWRVCWESRHRQDSGQGQNLATRTESNETDLSIVTRVSLMRGMILLQYSIKSINTDASCKPSALLCTGCLLSLDWRRERHYYHYHILPY